MSKYWFSVGCIFLAISVGIGAFGAHGLKAILIANNRVETFETAIKYQFYHSFGIIILSFVLSHIHTKTIDLIGILFVSGIFLFSGSLYVLCLTGLNWLGAITPIGGVAFIAAWLLLGYKCYTSKINS